MKHSKSQHNPFGANLTSYNTVNRTLGQQQSHSQLITNREAAKSVLSESQVTGSQMPHRGVLAGFDQIQSTMVTMNSLVRDAKNQGRDKKQTIELIQNIMRDNSSIKIIENNHLRLKQLQRGLQPPQLMSRRFQKLKVDLKLGNARQHSPYQARAQNESIKRLQADFNAQTLSQEGLPSIDTHPPNPYESSNLVSNLQE